MSEFEKHLETVIAPMVRSANALVRKQLSAAMESYLYAILSFNLVDDLDFETGNG